MSISNIDPRYSAQGATAFGGSPMQQVLGSVSDLLGMSQADVREALRSGSSLGDLAQQKGISTDQLVTTIGQALQNAGTAPGANSETADVTQLATEITTRKGHKGHGHHHRHHQADASSQLAATPVAPGADPLGGGSAVDLYA